MLINISIVHWLIFLLGLQFLCIFLFNIAIFIIFIIFSDLIFIFSIWLFLLLLFFVLLAATFSHINLFTLVYNSLKSFLSTFPLIALPIYLFTLRTFPEFIDIRIIILEVHIFNSFFFINNYQLISVTFHASRQRCELCEVNLKLFDYLVQHNIGVASLNYAINRCSWTFLGQ